MLKDDLFLPCELFENKAKILCHLARNMKHNKNKKINLYVNLLLPLHFGIKKVM